MPVIPDADPPEHDAEVVTLKELAITNMLDAQAVISLLVKKGIITKEEYLAEIKRLSDEIKQKRQRKRRG